MTTAVEEVKEETIFAQVTITKTDKGLEVKAENYEHNAQLIYMLNHAAVRIMEDMFKSDEDEAKED